jgi:MFS transporter, PPP family, 3-phenylpropionic acid transporter
MNHDNRLRPQALVTGMRFRLSLAQASSGLVNGVFLPFYGVWLAWRGLAPAHIAWILSAGYLLRAVLGPISGIVADARNDRRETMLALYWIMCLGYILMALSDRHLVIAAFAVLATTATGAVAPLLESVCVRLAAPFGFQYGRVRLWASAAFVAMSVIGGLLYSAFGAVVVAPLLGAFSVLCIVSTVVLPAPPPAAGRGGFAVSFRRTLAETFELLRSRVFLVFLASASLIQASHAFYYSYAGLHWRSLGYSGTLIGTLFPLGVIAEIAVLTFAHGLVRRLKPIRLLLLGGAAAAVRWTVMAFDPPLAVVIFVQLLHGGTFALAHVGAMDFIGRTVPPRLAATAQSLYFVCNAGLVIGVATYAAGLMYQRFGGLSYLLMSAMGLAAIAFALALERMWHGRRLVADRGGGPITTI